MHNRNARTLTLLAAALAIGEFASAVIIATENYRDSIPAFAVVFGVLFAVGVWVLRSGRVTAGSVIVGLLCLFQVVTFPSWQRHSAFDWAFQTSYAVVALAGLIAAIVVFAARRRSSATVAVDQPVATN